MKEAIHLIIMDRWGTGNISKKVCSALSISSHQLAAWRRSPAFREEFQRQLQLYRSNFDDIQMADRKERVKALDGLYQKIPDNKVTLKVKVLQAIRAEVGDTKEVTHTHRIEQPQNQGPNIPPRADSYEDWVKQNKQAVEAEVEVIPPDSTATVPSEAQPLLEPHNGEVESSTEEEITSEESPYEDPLFFLNGNEGI